MTQIAFIGGGNMASSIIGGLIKQGETKASLIHVSDPGAEQRSAHLVCACGNVCATLLALP